MGQGSEIERSKALDETVSLLREELRPPRGATPAYIDLLGKEDHLGPHSGQQIYRFRLFPLVYERLTRPLASRLFFGRGLSSVEERRITLELLDPSPGDRVLDVGCGPGNYTRSLADAVAGGLAVGIDPSKPMIASAAKHGGHSNLSYVRGDGIELPFLDEAFDAVSCVGAIHMMEEPMTALAEMIRVLVPGGRMVVVATCSTKDSPPRARGGMIVFGRDELTDVMAEHGLSDITQRVRGRGQFVAASKPTS